MSIDGFWCYEVVKCRVGNSDANRDFSKTLRRGSEELLVSFCIHISWPLFRKSHGQSRAQHLPDWTFCDFWASKSGDRRVLWSSERSNDGFWGSKTAKCSVGLLMLLFRVTAGENNLISREAAKKTDPTWNASHMWWKTLKIIFQVTYIRFM